MAAFDRIRLRPRVCVDVSQVDMSTECFGAKVSMPVGFSPAAMHGMAHDDAELGTSRAAAKAGCNMVLSTWSNHSIGDVVKCGDGYGNAYGQQLSIVECWDTNMHMIRNAESAYPEELS
jgi:(S)-2-hydroxy-acid oxidase